MTSMNSAEIECAHCGHHFKIIFEASINTWLDPNLIQKVLDDDYFYKCPDCKKEIHLHTKILINCPKGMFYIDTGLDLEEKKKILLSYDVIDEDGKISTPIAGVDRPSETHSAKVKDMLENIKNKLLKDN